MSPRNILPELMLMMRAVDYLSGRHFSDSSHPQIGSLSVVDIVDCVILPELKIDLVSATGFCRQARLFVSCLMGQGAHWEASSRSFMRSFTWAAQ